MCHLALGCALVHPVYAQSLGSCIYLTEVSEDSQNMTACFSHIIIANYYNHSCSTRGSKIPDSSICYRWCDVRHLSASPLIGLCFTILHFDPVAGEDKSVWERTEKSHSRCFYTAAEACMSELIKTHQPTKKSFHVHSGVTSSSESRAPVNAPPRGSSCLLL